MSVVEDVRQGLQDFLAPQLRELFARVDSLEKVMNARFEAMDTKFEALDTKFEALDTKLEAQDVKLGSIRAELRTRAEAQDVKFDAISKQIQGISDKLDLDRRITKLESQQAGPAAKTA